MFQLEGRRRSRVRENDRSLRERAPRYFPAVDGARLYRVSSGRVYLKQVLETWDESLSLAPDSPGGTRYVLHDYFAAVRDLDGVVTAGSAHRATHPVPPRLPDPPEVWAPAYKRMAEEEGLPWADLASLIVALRAFLEPVLTGVQGT